jgi:hypothetical protein
MPHLCFVPCPLHRHGPFFDKIMIQTKNKCKNH